MRPEADIWVDSDAFEQACQAGYRAASAGDAEGAADHLRVALDLYPGNYLPDALYEDWASAERERLLSLYLRAADKLTGLLVEQERYDEALDVCGRILSYDPCWERAYRWMMLAYARRGNRPTALRTYRRCVDTMQQELGVEPSPATKALYEQILKAEDLPVTVL
jgi:DNA-binding SARP family transcriptional activator